MLGDPTKFTQIIVNLLDNALKLTKKGSVNVEFNISVKDTGIGLSSEQQDRIFNRFVQGCSSTARNYRGSGLGLTIAKNLVNLHKGDLSVTSQLKNNLYCYTPIPYRACISSG